MQQFRDAIDSGDLDSAVALFSDDIVFRSPVVYTPYEGRAQVEALIRAVAQANGTSQGTPATLPV